MKKSEYNRNVIANFILDYTHQNEHEATGEAREMYNHLIQYIEGDHADGIDGDSDYSLVSVHYEVHEKDTGHGTKTIDYDSDIKALINRNSDRIEKGELILDRWEDGEPQPVDLSSYGL